MPSERFTLDLSPRLPVCCPTRDSHAAGTRLRRADRNPVVGVSNGLLWAATALPISATHVRRAGTPASRESSSARGSRLRPRSPSLTVSRSRRISWRLPASTTVAGRAHSLLAQPVPPKMICTIRAIPGSAPPRSPATDVSILYEFCLSGARAGTAFVRDERDRVLRRP